MISRAAVLISSAAVAAGSLAVLPICRVAALGVTGDDEVFAVQVALLETIVPCTREPFASIGAAAFVRRWNELFETPQRAGYAAAVIAFDRLQLYRDPPPITTSQNNSSHDANISADAARYDRWSSRWNTDRVARFIELAPAARAAFFRLWIDGDVLERRRFHQNIKALALASVYSHADVLHAIGFVT